MTKVISTTWPWTTAGLTIERIIQEALTLGCDDICIRATDGPTQYGLGLLTKARWGARTQHDLERAAKAAHLATSIWCPITLLNPAGEAAAIREAEDYYNPPAIYIDAESSAKKNIVNLGAFLRALGRRRARVLVQSYRRADLHAEMQWRKWLTYKDGEDRYIVDGLAPQMYPIGVHGPTRWIADLSRALLSHDRECAAAGRPDMPWWPTMPAFIGGTFEGQTTPWDPDPEDLLAAVEWLKGALGERLMGLNFWSLDRHLVKLPALAVAITGIQMGVPVAPPVVQPPGLTDGERLAALWRNHVYGGHAVV
jgi:hypothetical protein